MTLKRIFALIFIFLLGAGGWIVLGTVTELRSWQSDHYLGDAVEALWGRAIEQHAPGFSVKIPGSEQLRPLVPSGNKLDVALNLEYRQKGLVWYATFICDFNASYVITNHDAVRQKIRIHFPFPSETATYDRLKIRLDDQNLDMPINTREGINLILELEPGASKTFETSYRTRGLNSWRYVFDESSGRIRNLAVVLRTNFSAIDFPQGSLSPTQKDSEAEGMVLHWQAEDLITSQAIGMLMPERLNPGPLSARITFFAPVCLLFFFVLLASINVVYRVAIHPMHYLFVTAGFFAFHLLFAYLVDVVNLHLAFWLSAGISVSLVTLYLRAALGTVFPWPLAFAGQLFYMVLFSYSFFLKGITGLMVTLGAVLTLAILMKVTAATNWEQVFQKPAKPQPAHPQKLDFGLE